jgi:hypothetical protein
MKKKTYCYENRTFEVIVSDEYRGMACRNLDTRSHSP